MILTVCKKCENKMRQMYYMVETDEDEKYGTCQMCMPPRMAVVQQFELTPRNRPRPKPAQQGPAPKDSRARYKEPFRSGW